MKLVKHSLLILVTLCAALGLAGLALAGEVAQGITQKFDPAAKVLVIEEYDTNFDAQHPYGNPTGIVSEFDLSDAQVGLTPESGNIVRIAYLLDGQVKKAVKVMNVTKQSLQK